MAADCTRALSTRHLPIRIELRTHFGQRRVRRTCALLLAVFMCGAGAETATRWAACGDWLASQARSRVLLALSQRSQSQRRCSALAVVQRAMPLALAVTRASGATRVRSCRAGPTRQRALDRMELVRNDFLYLFCYTNGFLCTMRQDGRA